MKKFAFGLLAAVIFASCAPSTPLARIEKNPEKFAALGSEDQDLRVR